MAWIASLFGAPVMTVVSVAEASATPVVFAVAVYAHVPGVLVDVIVKYAEPAVTPIGPSEPGVQTLAPVVRWIVIWVELSVKTVFPFASVTSTSRTLHEPVDVATEPVMLGLSTHRTAGAAVGVAPPVSMTVPPPVVTLLPPSAEIVPRKKAAASFVAVPAVVTVTICEHPWIAELPRLVAETTALPVAPVKLERTTTFATPFWAMRSRAGEMAAPSFGVLPE